MPWDDVVLQCTACTASRHQRPYPHCSPPSSEAWALMVKMLADLQDIWEVWEEPCMLQWACTATS